MNELLQNVKGLVEANEFEIQALWKETFYDKSAGNRVQWSENRDRSEVCLGEINDVNVCFETLVYTINGHKVLFWSPTSSIVDYNMIADYFKQNMPEAYLNKAKATDFMNVVQRMK